MKKYVVPFGGACIIAIVLLGFWLFTPVNIFKAVPKSAIAIIEAYDWTKLNQQLGSTTAGTNLKNTFVIKRLTEELQVMQQLLSGNNVLQSKVLSSKIIASLHLTSASDFDFLFTTPVTGVDDNMVVQQLKTSARIKTINIRTFHNQKVIDIGLADGRQISFADLKGIFVFSFSSFLTESSITGIVSGKNVENDSEFKKVRKKFLSSGDLSVFFNFHETDVILPVFMNPELMPLLQDIRNFAGWGAYNISFANQTIKIEGTAHSVQKNKDAQIIYMDRDTVLANIPDNAAYVNIGVSQNSADSFFKEWAGSTHAFVTLEPLKEDFADENLFIISLNDKHKAYNCLKKLMTVNGSGNPVDIFGTTPVYSVQDGSIINRVYGGSITKFRNVYVALTDNVAVFGNTIDAVKFALDKIAKGETLTKIPDFKSSVSVVNSYVYIAPQKAALMIRDLMQTNSDVTNFLDHFDEASFFTVYRDGWINTTGSVEIKNTGKANAALLWKTTLKAPAAIAPQIVTNSSTGEKEIFIQDTLNNIYLLDKSGEILFSTLIDERILGNVFQLDYYDNGKLQYVFNTSAHIYIVDRLGNFVASYPIRLSHEASAGLVLIKDSVAGFYRYYVPCINGAVYGYESTGRPLPGWSPRNGLGIIPDPLQYIWTGNTLHVAAENNSGKLSLLDKRGATKWSLENMPKAGQGFSIIRQQDGFVLLNAAGNQLITISADGNDKTSVLIDSAHCFTATAISDTSYQYFFSNKNQIRSYNQKNIFQKSVGIGAGSIVSIAVQEIGDNKFVIVEDEASKKALIYDLELNPVAEYPVENLTLYAVTNLLGNNELIGLQAEKGCILSCYRLK